jgi:hypothetical protein
LPEPIAEVKLLAPHAFSNRRERAITAEDYAELAMRNPAIGRAAAELRWMGSWYEARVAITYKQLNRDDDLLLKTFTAQMRAGGKFSRDCAWVAVRSITNQTS